MSLNNIDLLAVDVESRDTYINDSIRAQLNSPDEVENRADVYQAILDSTRKEFDEKWPNGISNTNNGIIGDREFQIKSAAGKKLSQYESGRAKIAKSQIIQDYAEAYLDRNLGDGWETKFNRDYGKNASRVMKLHLANFIANSQSAELNKLSDWLKDKTLRENRPQEIWGALGLSETPEDLHAMLASRSFSSSLYQTARHSLTKTSIVQAAVVGTGLLTHTCCPALAPIYHLTVTSANINYGLSLGAAAVFLEIGNSEIKYLEKMEGRGQTPLGRHFSQIEPIPTHKAEWEKRGEESFLNLKSSMREMTRMQRCQLSGMSLVHLREFIDDYMDVQKQDPPIPKEQLFAQTVLKYKQNKDYNVDEELEKGPKQFKGQIIAALGGAVVSHYFSNEEPVDFGNCQPSCRLTTYGYAAILSIKSPFVFSSFSAMC